MKSILRAAFIVALTLLAASCANRQRGGSSTLSGEDYPYDSEFNPYANPNGSGYVEDIPLSGRPDGVNFFNSDVNRDLFPAVYFGFDQYDIQQSEWSKVQQVAEYLRTTPAKLIIAGHTDLVGTAEYNRNLGELRALAVRSALSQMGVDASRIQTVSYGEDYPTDNYDDDANRRAEFGFYR